MNFKLILTAIFLLSLNTYSFSQLETNENSVTDTKKTGFVSYINVGVGLKQIDFSYFNNWPFYSPYIDTALVTPALEYQLDYNAKIWGARFGVELNYYLLDYETSSTYSNGFGGTYYSSSSYYNEILKISFPFLIKFTYKSFDFSIGPAIELEFVASRKISKYNSSPGDHYYSINGTSLAFFNFKKNPIWYHFRIGVLYNISNRWNIQANVNLFPPYGYQGLLKVGFKLKK